MRQLRKIRPCRGALLILCLACLIVQPERSFATSAPEKDPFERREAKLKEFREKRDRFFKEDPHSPLKDADRRNFKGLPYYPVDLRYAVIGSFTPYPTEPKPLYVTLPTSKGTGKKYVKHGSFKFELMGKEHLLQIYKPLGGGELFLPFRDETSGKETYGEGRYLYIEPMSDGRVLIDFNRAHNPFCQFNEKYTCPFAPEENWLRVPIRAGEKKFR